MTGDMWIFPSNGSFCSVSREDYDALKEFKWTWYRSRRCCYAMTRVRVDGRLERIYMHRLVTGVSAGYVVDHINGNGMDNRRENLRIATYQENARNRRPRDGSFKGVKRVGKRWRATITVDGGKRLLIGDFDTPEKAAHAYDLAATDYFGEFAWTNNVGPQDLSKLLSPGESQSVQYSNNTSGYRGVSWHAVHRRFIASFRGEFLGYFDTAEEAAVASDQARSGSETPRPRRVVIRTNRSGFRGVSASQTPGKWIAYITADGRARNLGTHTTREEAARAYDKAAVALHGERAILNFPVVHEAVVE